MGLQNQLNDVSSGSIPLLVLAQISEAGRDGAATNNKMHGSSWSVTSLIDNCPI